jgi:hypothetical protein
MGKPKGYVPSDAEKQKLSETLKQRYAEGRQLAGAALASSLTPKQSAEELKAKRAEQQRRRRAKAAGYAV